MGQQDREMLNFEIIKIRHPSLQTTSSNQTIWHHIIRHNELYYISCLISHFIYQVFFFYVMEAFWMTPIKKTMHYHYHHCYFYYDNIWNDKCPSLSVYRGVFRVEVPLDSEKSSRLSQQASWIQFVYGHAPGS